MNQCDYDNFHSVKRMVVLYNWLEKQAAAGDGVAAAIWVDIKTAIYGEPRMKGRMLEIVELIGQHYMPQEEVAKQLEVSQEYVSVYFNRGVNKIQKKLLSGKMYGK